MLARNALLHAATHDLIHQPKVKALCDKTRSMQRGTEAAMTQLYEGRRINIVGDINAVLSGT